MIKEKISVLVVDDEEGVRVLLSKGLEKQGYNVFLARNGQEGLDKARSLMPDIILLDIMMPGIDGKEVKRRLNQDPVTAIIPVIFLTAKDATEDKVEGFNLEAEDYVTKPFELAELLARIEAHANRRKRYINMFLTDALTGLCNVHVFKRDAQWLFGIAKRYNRTFSMAIVDVDDFKNINDQYGHLAGDEVLKYIAFFLKKSFREQDIVIRYGGDEFVILMPETSLAHAKVAIDRLKGEMSASNFIEDKNGQKISFTVSVGVAEYVEGLHNEMELFEKADQSMYQGKK